MEAHIVKLANANGGHWGEHPKYPSEDWQLEVANGDCRLGYWEWIQSLLDHGLLEEDGDA